MELSFHNIGLGFLVLGRLSGLMVSAPFLGLSTFPVRVRVALALLITFLLLSNLQSAPPPPQNLVLVLLFSGAEFVLGLAVGHIVSFCLVGFRMAGELAGSQMGLGFGALVDPISGDQSTILARFLGLTALTVVVAMDGHHILIRGLSLSFEALPPGMAAISLPQVALSLPNAAASIFITALVVAAPALAAVFCIKIALALLARAAPQLHILVIGFIITIMVGLSSFAITLPGLGHSLRAAYMRGAEQAMALFAVAG